MGLRNHNTPIVGHRRLSIVYRILYRILGILLVAIAIFLVTAHSIIGVIGVALTIIIGIFGCLLLQTASWATEATKGIPHKNPFKRSWQIAIIILYILFAIIGSQVPTTVQSISVDGNTSIGMQVPDTQQIVFRYEPQIPNTSDIKCVSSDQKIATVTIDEAINGKVICTVTPVSAGIATITCTAPDISSAPVKLSITDPVAEAEAERKAAEEAAKQAEHEAAEKKAQEMAQELLSKANEDQPNDEPTGQTVYVTRSGERYHLDPDCAGKSARAVDINDVGARTPCKKCAGG